jgi:hypothetical protein
MKNITSPKQSQLQSYRLLRIGIGIIGVLLPPVLILGKIILESPGISPSISAYYYSVMRDVFVGCLWVTGIFLISYSYALLDTIVSMIAGICAIGVALFPTPPIVDATARQNGIGVAHGVFASCFFLLLALMAIVLFTKQADNPTPRKLWRNKVYRGCGIAIIACVVLSALTLFVPYLHEASWLQLRHPIFWLETVSILAFGFAWFVKADLFILKDQKRGDVATSTNRETMLTR